MLKASSLYFADPVFKRLINFVFPYKNFMSLPLIFYFYVTIQPLQISMMKLSLKTIWQHRNTALLIGACLLALISSVRTFNDIKTNLHKRQRQPAAFLGAQFQGLEKLLGTSPRVGYYTNQSLDDFKAAAIFAQAQYTLAPIILEFNNLELPFTIFSCASSQACLSIMKERQMVPVKMNTLGVIVAFNPKARP